MSQFDKFKKIKPKYLNNSIRINNLSDIDLNERDDEKINFSMDDISYKNQSKPNNIQKTIKSPSNLNIEQLINDKNDLNEIIKNKKKKIKNQVISKSLANNSINNKSKLLLPNITNNILKFNNIENDTSKSAQQYLHLKEQQNVLKFQNVKSQFSNKKNIEFKNKNNIDKNSVYYITILNFIYFIDQREIIKLINKFLNKIETQKFMKWQKNSYKDSDVRNNPNLIGKNLINSKIDIDKLKLLFEELPLTKKSFTEKLLQLKYPIELLNIINKILFQNRKEISYNEFEQFLNTQIFTSEIDKCFLLSFYFLDLDQKHQIDNKDIFKLIHSKQNNPFSRDQQILYQYLHQKFKISNELQSNFNLNLDKTKNKKVNDIDKKVENLRQVNDKLTFFKKNYHKKNNNRINLPDDIFEDISNHLLYEDKLNIKYQINYKEFIVLDYLNTLPDTFGIVINIMLGSFVSKQLFTHRGLNPVLLKYYQVSEIDDDEQSQEEFEYVSNEMKYLKSNINNLSHDFINEKCKDFRINKFIKVENKSLTGESTFCLRLNFDPNNQKIKLIVYFVKAPNQDQILKIKTLKNRLMLEECDSEVDKLIKMQKESDIKLSMLPPALVRWSVITINTQYNLVDHMHSEPTITSSSIQENSKFMLGVHCPILAKSIFSFLDKNSDGEIDFLEFKHFLRFAQNEKHQKENESEWYDMIFKIFDLNDDNKITIDDVMELRKKNFNDICPNFHLLFLNIVDILDRKAIDNSKKQAIKRKDLDDIIQILQYHNPVFEKKILINTIKTCTSKLIEQRQDYIYNRNRSFDIKMAEINEQNYPIVMEAMNQFALESNDCQNNSNVWDYKLVNEEIEDF